MLGDAELQTIVWTADVERARAFYADILALPELERSHGALVFQVGSGRLRVSPVPETGPSPHTVAGFSVRDLAGEVRGLAANGVSFERFEGFAQDSDGIWAAPDGARVAWFRDPDGNLLSIVQYAGS